MPRENQPCVYPTCSLSRRTRGLCHGHYQTMRSYVRKAVKEGLCTEAEYEADLMARGLLLEKGTGGSKVRAGYDGLRFGAALRGTPG